VLSLRTTLVSGCVLAIGFAAWLGHPSAYLLPAAVLFHVGALSMLVVGWRDRC